MREMLLTHKDILLKLEQLEKKMLKQNEKLVKHDEYIQLIFEALKKMLTKPEKPRPQIGFKRSCEK